MGIVFAFLSALSFAIGNVVIRQGMDRSGDKENGFLITVVFNVVFLGLIFLIHWIWRGFIFHVTWSALFFFVLGGVLTTGIGRFVLFESIRRINSMRASAIKNGAPVFTVLFALLFLDETIGWIAVIGMLFLFLALFIQGFIFFRKSNTKNGDNPKDPREWIGYLLAVLSALCFGLGQGVRKQGLLIVNDAFFGAWVGAVTSLVFIFIYEAVKGRLREKIHSSRTHLNRYFIAAGIMTCFGPLFFFLGASFTQVSYVSVVAAVEPILTVMISTYFLKGQERVTWSILVTIVMILVGTTLISFSS
jgi:drug/metabolite transporter (DMT)-like permease